MIENISIHRKKSYVIVIEIPEWLQQGKDFQSNLKTITGNKRKNKQVYSRILEIQSNFKMNCTMTLKFYRLKVIFLKKILETKNLNWRISEDQRDDYAVRYHKILAKLFFLGVKMWMFIFRECRSLVKLYVTKI